MISRVPASKETHRVSGLIALTMFPMFPNGNICKHYFLPV